MDAANGFNRYLPEIRNVFKSSYDVTRTFGDPEHNSGWLDLLTIPTVSNDLWIAGIDYGETVTAAVSVSFPTAATNTLPATSSTSAPPAGTRTLRNLTIKRKALMQPQLKYHRVLEEHKSDVAVREAEQAILPRKGVPDSDVVEFLRSLHSNQKTLDKYYNHSFWHRRNAWDFKKAKQGEYDQAVRGVLDMVKEAPRDKVIFSIGLGKFGSNSKSPSLHGTFGAKLVPALRAQGFAVTGINEYYTSQKCSMNRSVSAILNPCNHGFVGRVNLRRSYCSRCQMYFHRDILPCQNMIRATESHLVHQTRPAYLQPVTSAGGN
ncbi:hypothetical protein BGZ98_009904 [Dissophora globulifera]|nr:hypothetical protein BGZ98_009904 [Dissophora globulifera]